MTDLLNALNALTKPRKSKVVMTNDHGVTCTSLVELPALLEQLENAILGSFGSDGGSSTSSPGNLRNVVDSDALYQFAKISTEVVDWCRTRKVPATRKPMVDLKAWHEARISDERDSYYTRRLTLWASAIEEKLRPKKRLEITEPCPICGADKWVDAEGEVMRFPVVVEYDADGGAGLMDGASAICRNASCQYVWSGGRELRQLRWDIDAREAG
jgi:hypothetical protein